MKKRILMVNESSLLSTGYSTYGYEVLRRLHATGKYELAELASYGSHEDVRVNNIPWKYYPVMPKKDDKAAQHIYASKVTNQWGEYVFEDVCLDFKPDVAFSIRDVWADEFISRSPAREYFYWAYMPTVDSAPSNNDWLPTFANADAIFTYTDWGMDVLKEETNCQSNLRCTASPGADLINYKFVDKKEVRKRVGLPEDIFIIGTVMRNQVRKLYPDLMQAFAQLLETAPVDIANKSYLYLHCAYPDVGWDIPRLLKEHGIAHRTYFTYYCLDCKEIYPSFFQDGKAPCRLCGAHKAILPNIKSGVPPNVLNEIYGLFNIYVQYASNEGLGMPQVESAASGTPVMAVDYSAMSDVVRKLHGFPIKVERMFRDAGTESYRALPNNNDLVEKLVWYLSLPKNKHLEYGTKAREGVLEHYTWEKTAKTWESYFDEVIPLDKWKEPVRIHTPNMNPPSGMSDKEFVNWAFTNIAGCPELADSYLAIRLTRDLGLGACLKGLPNMLVDEEHSSQSYPAYGEFTREVLASHLLNLCHVKNNFEKKRGKL